MIDSGITKGLNELFHTSKRKKIPADLLFSTARDRSLNQDSDLAVEKKLLQILEQFAREGVIKLPAAKGKKWDVKTKLPHHVTLVNTAEDIRKKRNKQERDDILNSTSWEPEKMIPIIHGDCCPMTLDDCKKAQKVNSYLINRPLDQPMIPARERALRIFGDEKALDKVKDQGLFSGSISLKDLDCFYCPEPIPFYPLSPDVQNTRGKALLFVENANTYESCRRANQITQTFAAIVYGKGFKAATKPEKMDGIVEIEAQLESQGLWYFGDLDPAGLAIPRTINKFRKQAKLPLIQPAIPLYRVLMAKGYFVPYRKTSQKKFHDEEWAIQWLGKELALSYLEKVEQFRWPQEGLSQRDLEIIFMEYSGIPMPKVSRDIF
ncbi:hypothetical protein SAMN02746065_104129 [Desulfocicer vacuolatum DSM 3385]|uniref:Wadjet protein JetD C-terminal domain-containing protein n=1 Tax=Desulfocicer vacuolatum DSM 3385 TaxID=1121400 RepID=A0A1W2A542_9BACT|nr:Wadjet anti-phage system protein JetD domain-containing protein [Desulfocicer vacuolatum]SMC55794.1 hypothetical protein SAMN02746065_104129 [Desulfocicer vacuolatum DSM 3385]